MFCKSGVLYGNFGVYFDDIPLVFFGNLFDSVAQFIKGFQILRIARNTAAYI